MKKDLKSILADIIGIHDTPHKIAAGFGLGVFTGIMPFAGPIIALMLATVCKVNKVSAVAGSVLTNTWISVVVFAAAAKVGAFIMGMHWHDIRDQWVVLMKDFHSIFLMKNLLLLGAVVLGYCAIAACLGVICYAVSFLLIRAIRFLKGGVYE